MPISRYPRVDEPVVPRLVYDLLKERGVNGIQPLGSAAWRRLGESQCRHCADRLIAKLASLGEDFFVRFASRPVALNNDTVPIDDLQLGRRTLNCFRRAKLSYVSTGPNGITVGDLANIRGFGVRCFVDFAASLESRTAREPGQKRVARLGKERKLRQTTTYDVAANGIVRGGMADALAEISSIPGALAVTRRDPRLGSWLQSAVPGAPTLAAAVNDFQSGKLPAVACKGIQRLSKAIRTMARAKLEDEVLAIMSAGCGIRDRELIAACLEWRTKRRPTYGSVGKHA
jgi:hypothetical protein